MRNIGTRKGGGRGKLPRAVISVIITLIIAVILIAAILITNVFIPVKYLTAYTVKRNKNGKGVLRVSYIDVDFGDCTLIELPDGKNVLIDGGDGAYSNNLHIMRFLNSRGVDTIDCLICTSPLDEHCGGLSEILKYKTVRYAFVPYCRNTRITSEFHSFMTALEKSGTEFSYACVGEGISGEEYDYYFTFLSPVNYQSPDSEYSDMNARPTAANIENASVVTWFEYDGISFVFTSDIRAKGLKRIVDEYTAAKELGQTYCMYGGHEVVLENAKVVTAPAHGGADNTYALWYDLIAPEQTVISVGKNFANYPSVKALSDICNYCTPLYTMYSGDITFTVKDGAYKITTKK